MTTRIPWYESENLVRERPQPIPLTEQEEEEKAHALIIFEKYRKQIMDTIGGFLSSASEEEKDRILSELIENCPSLYEYADEMRKAHTKFETAPWNGKTYVVKDQNKIVSNLRDDLLRPAGFEGKPIFMWSSARATCDEAYWSQNHWCFNSIILFIIEKIGLLEVKEILKSTI